MKGVTPRVSLAGCGSTLDQSMAWWGRIRYSGNLPEQTGGQGPPSLQSCCGLIAVFVPWEPSMWEQAECPEGACSRMSGASPLPAFPPGCGGPTLCFLLLLHRMSCSDFMVDHYSRSMYPSHVYQCPNPPIPFAEIKQRWAVFSCKTRPTLPLIGCLRCWHWLGLSMTESNLEAASCVALGVSVGADTADWSCIFLGKHTNPSLLWRGRVDRR